MTKIAIVSTMGAFPWGGSEYLWAAMAEQALLDGHEVFISIYDWSVNHPLVIQLQQHGAKLLPRPRFYNFISRLSKRISKKIPLLNFISPQSHYQPIFDCKPDVICISQGHIYDAVFYQPDLVNLLNFTSIPFLIISQLNVDNVLLDSNTLKIAQQLFSQANYHVFVSQQNMRLAERQLAQSLPNALVLQNPVNLSDVTMLSWPYESTICFASVARLDVAFKSQDILFETLSLPLWQHRNWQCNLYGAGSDRAYLEALSRYYGIADRVKFMGHINDVRSIWSNNHILLLPSRAEGTPLALVEAMLCGRPAVVTDVGGNAEWIEDGETGFIADAPTVKLFNAALDRAWQAQNNWKQMGIKAHEYATTKLDYSPGRSLLKLVLEASKT
ncbi:MAG: glycosyltransferase [Chlorogloeopsis fritschii C42_A2020_084]|uniref:glycosyltransferase n=1 Tax=Chlorogloeopsis fritschii TaxID=1124 RepID=UPI001A09CA74|nr:glycosyltransferase [Chlorogloeopsis fritschii]MBF2004219.1 glycosyltransferase [Chlorogloeopsis fritschii C42_A2020_084]